MTLPFIMRRLLSLTAAMAIIFAMAGLRRAAADDIVPGHVLVRVQAGADAQKLAADNGTIVLDQLSGTDLYDLKVPSTTTETAFATQLSKDKRVIYAEPNRYVTSPEVRGEPFHFAFDLSSKPAAYANSASYVQIDAGMPGTGGRVKAAPALATGKGVVIAVLDTGVTFTHPDLKGHLLPGFNAVNPGQAPNDVADGIVNYEVGHGTMVTGVIVRLAPDAKIMPVRVLNGDGAGNILDLIQGIRYATTHGAQIISMSFGCSTKMGALNDALDDAELAGIILVASAGNDNASQVNPPTVSRGTVSVASVEMNNKKSPYSNFGSFVRVSAPGSNIRSTYSNGGYATWSGTSFAAPFVSAEAALILSVNHALTAEQVTSLIRNNTRSVDQANPTYKGQLGKGLIDIETAVRAAHP